MYKIIIANMTKGFPSVVEVDRQMTTADRIAYNLQNLWAWNLWNTTSNDTFNADGPAVFIKWCDV